MSVTVPDWLLISATRYALGRSSYVVSDTALELTHNWHHLDGNTRHIILRDIREYLSGSGERSVDQPWRDFLRIARATLEGAEAVEKDEP